MMKSATAIMAIFLASPVLAHPTQIQGHSHGSETLLVAAIAFLTVIGIQMRAVSNQRKQRIAG